MKRKDPFIPSAKKRGFAKLLPAGIRARLFLLIILVLLPQGLFLTWIYNERYQTQRTQAMNTELEVAQGVAMAFSGYVEGVWRKNHAIGEAIRMFSPPVLPKARRLMTITATQHASIRSFNWVSPQGVILASSQPVLEGKDLSALPYFIKIVTGAEWSISDLSSRGIKVQAPTFTIATACRDDQGKLHGVVVAAIEPERLGELTLTQRRLGKGAYAIFDSQGVIVYHSIYQKLAWEDRSGWRKMDTILQAALKTRTPQVGIAVPVLRKSEWVSARVPMQDLGWVVGAGKPVEVAFGPLRQALVREISFSLLALALAFLSAYMVARTIALPLQRLERTTTGMGSTPQEAPEDPLAPLEVCRLRHVIMEMADNLRAGEKRFRLALENIPDMIAICDQQLRIQYVNPATISATGLPSSKLVGRLDSEIWPELYKLWRPVLEKALETAKVQNLELELPSPEGSRHFHVTYVPLMEENGQVKELMGITHDYTVRKQAEDELKRTLEELIRSNRELEQFAYVASHDLQEPLRMVASYVQLLEKRYRGQLDQQADRYIDYAIQGAKRMQTLIEDLLAYGRINRVVEFQQVDLDMVCADAVKAMGTAISESEGAIRAADLPVVWGDKIQLFILFQNLIGNAIKYRRQDVQPLVLISAQQTEDAWVISVRDNGIGIEKQYFDRIFQIFQRLHAREEYPGTGIGLASCKKIVERHGGRIWVESVPGNGSTFFFTIPDRIPSPGGRQHP
ncbi:sensor histidine kinase [Geotalea toluenoxydans]